MKRIWIPEAPYIHRHRLIEAEICSRASIAGFITMELVRKDSGLIARRLRFRNLITDAGLNAMAGTLIANLTTYCGVGTGTSTPTTSQTQLDNQLIRTNSAGGFSENRGVDGGLAFTWWQRTRVFTTEQANGNLTEIGFFSAASGGTMFARQLIKDENGDPTAITKTDEYELRVTYEVRWYIPAEDEYSAMVDGVSRTIRTRASRVINNTSDSNRGWRPDGSMDMIGALLSGGGCTIYTGSLGAITSNPSGTQLANSTAELQSYGTNTFTNQSYYTWGAGVGNDTEYKSFTPGFRAPSVTRSSDIPFQHEILDATVIKNNTQRFDLYASVTWDRYVEP
jgi:hypothetical protein